VLVVVVVVTVVVVVVVYESISNASGRCQGDMLVALGDARGILVTVTTKAMVCVAGGDAA
jgi:hypothetical protein